MIKEEEEEHISIAQLLARRKRAKRAEVIVPIAVIDTKGKAIEVPTRKPHKKGDKSKLPVKEAPKKGETIVFTYVCCKNN